jgi:anti-sigma regulatory factor (Ser/Thr protein kinase)
MSASLDPSAGPPTGPPTGPSTHVRRRFDGRPEHVRDAREHVADLLSQRGWSAAAIEKARLVISELATNAILHAQTPFELTCRIDGVARFEVRDWEPSSTPLVVDAAPGRPGGLGLRLIEAIATDWGVESHSAFKVVWCTVAADDRPAGPASPDPASPDPASPDPASAS